MGNKSTAEKIIGNAQHYLNPNTYFHHNDNQVDEMADSGAQEEKDVDYWKKRIATDVKSIKNTAGSRDLFTLQDQEILQVNYKPQYLKDIDKIWEENPLQEEDSPIIKLPLVMIWEISLYLDPIDIVSWESTCTHFRLKFNKNPDFWKSIYYQQFISVLPIDIPKDYHNNPWKFMFNRRMKAISLAKKIFTFIKGDNYNMTQMEKRNIKTLIDFSGITGIHISKEEINYFANFYKNYLSALEYEDLKQLVKGRYVRIYKLTSYLKVHYTHSSRWSQENKKVFRREGRASKFYGCIHISNLFVSLMLIRFNPMNGKSQTMQNELYRLFEKEKNASDTRRIIQLMRKHTLNDIEKLLEKNQKLTPKLTVEKKYAIDN